jgi:hypothetical protein
MCCTSVSARLALALCLAAAPCAAQLPPPRACSIADQLHGDFEVHHVGSYAGTSSLGAVIELDNSGHDVKKLDVLVNLPGKAVVLVMTAYDPVVWNVAWTPGTRIVGAMVSGYHGQAVLGIPKSVPLYLSTYEQRRAAAGSSPGGCPYLYAYEQGRDNAGAGGLIEKIVGRSVTRFVRAPRTGVAVVGEPASTQGKLESSPDYRLEEFTVKRGPDEVPAGQRGLQELARRGLLREATQKDIRAFEASGVTGIIRGIPTYVVLKPLTMPDGLYGGHSVNILIPKGAPMPDGPRGHNGFYFQGKEKCEGPICG